MRYIYCPQCGRKLTEIHAGDDGMVPYNKRMGDVALSSLSIVRRPLPSF